MTYGHEPAERILLRDLELREICPAARGSGSAMGTSQLDRWKAVYEAVVDWHQGGASLEGQVVADIEARLFGSWDAVQRSILIELFAAYRRLHHPVVTAVDLDPEGGRWTHEETNTKVTVGVQLDVQTDDGWEAVRIKTGRTVTSELEASAFYREGEERVLVDVQLGADDRVSVARPDPDAAERLLVEVARRWDATRDSPRSRVAGLHCYSCDRPARCGQYPVIGGDVGRWTRTIRISKTRLAGLERCQRSSLWPGLYAIPKDEGDDGESTSAGLRSEERRVGEECRSRWWP